MNRRAILALPLAILIPASGLVATSVAAAEAPEISVYLNPN